MMRPPEYSATDATVFVDTARIRRWRVLFQRNCSAMNDFYRLGEHSVMRVQRMTVLAQSVDEALALGRINATVHMTGSTRIETYEPIILGIKPYVRLT